MPSYWLEENLWSQVPFLGGPVRRSALKELLGRSAEGDHKAIQALLRAMQSHPQEDIQHQAENFFHGNLTAECINTLWEIWVRERSAFILEILQAHGQPASRKIPAWGIPILSRLKLHRASDIKELLKWHQPDPVFIFIQACSDPDSEIQAAARTVLTSLTSQDHIQSFCQEWLKNRSPLLTEILVGGGYLPEEPPEARIMVALKLNRMDIVLHAASGEIQALIAALQDQDPEIAQRAAYVIRNLQNQDGINQFCQIWNETKSPLLTDILVSARYIPTEPANLQLLCALTVSRQDIVEQISPEMLPALIQYSQHNDPVIQTTAINALHQLKKVKTREAICQMALEHPDSPARKLAVEAGYVPRSPEKRALFLFLTDQWDKYDELDFDQRILRSVYETANQDTRLLITRSLQHSGRADYLSILTGVDFRSRAGKITPEEARLTIRMLKDRQEWEKLWVLSQELALIHSIEIIRILGAAGWQPGLPNDRDIFQQLVVISHKPITLNNAELVRSLPPALPRATLRVTGRINDVAFSPVQPVVALATNARKVILWNFQLGKIQTVIKDPFQHSIGKVAYSPSGTLIIGERTSSREFCQVMGWFDDRAFEMGYHQGSVTGILPIGDDLVLTGGRDQMLKLWNLRNHTQIHQAVLGTWPRSMAISPDQTRLAWASDSIHLLKLPDLNQVRQFRIRMQRKSYQSSTSVIHALAFSPTGSQVVCGHNNGQITTISISDRKGDQNHAFSHAFGSAVTGVRFVPGHNILISASKDGQIQFSRWGDQAKGKLAFSPFGQITSVQVSPTGDFMATGTSSSSLVLWDLRTLDIPRLFSLPLASALPAHLTAAREMRQYAGIPQWVQAPLDFLILMLQRKFQYDIQVDEIIQIQAGEFDIMIDGIEGVEADEEMV